MPRRPRIHIPGGFYHVTLRGNHRQPVFECDADRYLLNKIVARAIEKYGARVHAYCWMSNHIHLLIQIATAPLALPMRQIGTEFARAMQSKIATTGHFFESRHHAVLIEATDYLFTVLKYIPLNPVAAGIVANAVDYRWSSHRTYLGDREDAWLTTEYILGKFSPDWLLARREYQALIEDENRNAAYLLPEGGFVFGSDEFIARVRGSDAKKRSRQQLEELIGEACRRFELERNRLDSPVRDQYTVKVRAWIAFQAEARGVANRSEVARALGRSEATLRSAISRYPGELE